MVSVYCKCATAAVIFAGTLFSNTSALAQTPAMQTCELGDLKLESGEVIKNFRMTYITHGTLNAGKSNAILSIHGLQGNRNNQSYWVGPGKAFDPKRYFIIQPDTLGVASTDPHATTSPTRSGLAPSCFQANHGKSFRAYEPPVRADRAVSQRR